MRRLISVSLATVVGSLACTLVDPTIQPPQTQPVPAGYVQMGSILDPFDWPLTADGLGPYSAQDRPRYEIGGGEESHGLEIKDGILHLFATHGTKGTSWHGITYLLAGTLEEPDIVIDPTDPFPEAILPAHRVLVSHVRFVASGQGSWAIEIKRPDDTIAFSSKGEIDTDVPIEIEISLPDKLAGCRLLNLLVQSTNASNADVAIDEIGFKCNVPQHLADEPAFYAFVTSYAQLLRMYDPVSGFTRDHLHFRSGDFDNLTTTAAQIPAAAAAYDLGVISLESARGIATRSATALLSVPREPETGLLPHWLFKGIRHPSSEWSTIDTGVAIVASIEGLAALDLKDLANRTIGEIVAHINYAELLSSNGALSQGVDKDGNQVPTVWQYRDPEQILAEMPRAIQQPDAAPVAAEIVPETFRQVGFILELGALFVPQLGSANVGADRTDINWYERRVAQAAAQQSFLAVLVGHPVELLGGFTEMEILRKSDAATAFLAAGIGSTNPPALPLYTLDGFGSGPWLCPAYVSMIASLDVAAASSRVQLLRDSGAWPPLSGPAESIQLDANGSIATIHRAQISLRASIHVLGLYHAIAKSKGRADVVYKSIEASVIEAAIGSLIGDAGASTATPLPVSIEGENAQGNGVIMQRSEASGQKTRWLHAGESATFLFSLDAQATYSLVIHLSNDNPGSLEAIDLSQNGTALGTVNAVNTGNGSGTGWNVFAEVKLAAPISLQAGSHQLDIAVRNGDGFGVEIDRIELVPV